MTEIGFYHLTRSSADQALPKLLGRTLAAGQRAVVRCNSAEHLVALDAALWACADPDWLPHGNARTGHPELQPIWLTLEDEAQNGARFLFLLNGGEAQLAAYDRVFDLFDGQQEPAVIAARERWSAAKAAGHALTYWQQGDRGWVKKS